jgi:hypothetical protein
MNTQPTETLNPPGNRNRRRDWRRDRRLARTGGWLGGAVLVALGVVLLMQNVTGFDLGNWWALFILIPAAGALVRAWQSYREAGGRLNARARSALFGGVILVLIAAAFLFGADWTLLGPAVLILVGGLLLVTSLWRA